MFSISAQQTTNETVAREQKDMFLDFTEVTIDEEENELRKSNNQGRKGINYSNTEVSNVVRESIDKNENPQVYEFVDNRNNDSMDFTGANIPPWLANSEVR